MATKSPLQNVARGVLGAAAAALILGVAGCAVPYQPVVPYFGTGYNGTTAPVDIGFKNTTIGPDRGSTKAKNLLFGFFAWGDATVATAARNGGLTEVDHIDSRMLNVLFIYQEYELVVWGTKGSAAK